MLLFDLGNTSLKCALWKEGSVGAEKSFSIAEDFAEKLSSWLKEFAGSEVFISSVVPEKLSNLKAVLEKENFTENRVINTAEFKVIETNIEKAENVGIDRLLASRAAFEQSGGAVVTVDFGSAVTVDYVDGRGVFQGGTIMPGALLWYKALKQNTAQLPLVSIAEKPQSAVGKDTVSAIQAGTFFGIAGAVNALVEKCMAESGSSPEIFVTGGGYLSVKDNLSFKHIYDRNLVFKGIAAAAGSRM